MRFTEEQQSVIDARGQSLLVSAAAGSGKTSVLVERIFSLISGEDAVDVDELLVLTFTRAAAYEMKERIRARIEEAIANDPANERLRRQEILLHQAQITTIDAFCQYVIRENFPLIDLDPQARVADEGEIRLLRQQMLRETLDGLYEEGDPDFLYAAEYVTANVRDDALEDMIAALADQALSHPFPADYLDALGNAVLTKESFEAAPPVVFALRDILRTLRGCTERLTVAVRLCQEDDALHPYAETMEEDIRMLRDVLRESADGEEVLPDFETLRAKVVSLSFSRLKAVKSADSDPQLKETVKGIRDEVKKQTDEIKKRYFCRGKEEILAESAATAEVIRALTKACALYLEQMEQAKREANIIDFSDMEHFALRILTQRETDENGNVTYQASDTAKAYRQRFAYVMVDEYQDSNLIQETLLQVLSGEEDGRYNRFMVGDVKQSIYRFRLARPELFTEKYLRYQKEEDAKERRIDLHVNFRSVPEVLKSVNAVFKRLMGQDLGDIAYDEDAMLRAPKQHALESDAAAPAAPSSAGDAGVPDTRSELLLCAADSHRTEHEAAMIAARIRELLREGYRYGDIVILMRSMAGRDEIFRKELEAYGIPVYVESRTGYFSAPEVQTVLQTLSVINNPLSDIALLTVLRAPFSAFTDEELALIRIHGTADDADCYFYERMEHFADPAWRDAARAEEEERPELHALREKTAAWLARYAGWRKRSLLLPLHELLTKLLEETGYLSCVSALPGGTKRKANLEMLLLKARSYEKTRYRGLGGFIAYIDALQQYEIDSGEANILDEYADVVRIMSIHKSKGLEFPVVFVADCARHFNLRDTRGDLLIDPALGVGLSLIDPEKRTRHATLEKQVIARKLTLDTLGEELRILYVAMTRAKKKLLLTACVKHPEEELEQAKARAERGDHLLSYPFRTGAKSYLQWLLGALAGSDEEPVRIRCIEEEHTVTEEEILTDTVERLALLDDTQAHPSDPALSARLQERFSWRYPHEAYAHLFTKTTVTELKEARLRETEEADVLEPYTHAAPERAVRRTLFMGEQKDAAPDPALRGTLYHKAMELLCGALPVLLREEKTEDNLSLKEDALSRFLQKEEQEGRLQKGGVSTIQVKDLSDFWQTSLARRMMLAAKEGRLFTERQFMIGIPARELNDTLPEGETLIVQGVIDCYFEEEDGLILLDYKTDQVRDGRELVRRYRTQMDYYERALQQLTGKTVKEKWIWSFALGKEIAC